MQGKNNLVAFNIGKIKLFINMNFVNVFGDENDIYPTYVRKKKGDMSKKKKKRGDFKYLRSHSKQILVRKFSY